MMHVQRGENKQAESGAEKKVAPATPAPEHGKHTINILFIVAKKGFCDPTN
jgi:hypothetical protein